MAIITLQDLSDQLARIETLTAMGAKEVLNIDEAMLYTGLPKATMYELTRERRIPHSKRGKRLYFAKNELAAWLLKNRVKTQEEIEEMAATYVATHPH